MIMSRFVLLPTRKILQGGLSADLECSMMSFKTVKGTKSKNVGSVVTVRDPTIMLWTRRGTLSLKISNTNTRVETMMIIMRGLKRK